MKRNGIYGRIDRLYGSTASGLLKSCACPKSGGFACLLAGGMRCSGDVFTNGLTLHRVIMINGYMPNGSFIQNALGIKVMHFGWE